MGYPMTYRRVMARNRLQTGDYSNPPNWPAVGLNPNVLPDFAGDEVKRLRSQLGLLCGDLRRLEKDATDEQAVCRLVADRTGVDREIVAAVLQAFLEDA